MIRYEEYTIINKEVWHLNNSKYRQPRWPNNKRHSDIDALAFLLTGIYSIDYMFWITGHYTVGFRDMNET